MSFGLNTWSGAGVLELDSSSYTMHAVLSVLVSSANAGQYIDYSIPGVTPSNCIAIVIPISVFPDPGTQNAANRQFEPQVLNNLVRVWFGNKDYISSGSIGAQGTQRLIVMRYS